MEDSASDSYLFDANCFDYILDNGIDPRLIRHLGSLYITSVQHAELMRVPDPKRRKQLMRVVSAINPTVTPVSIGVWLRASGDIGGHASVVEPTAVADKLHGGSRKAGKWKDAAMAEAADLAGFVLVTDDKPLRRSAAALGIATLACSEAFASLGT